MYTEEVNNEINMLFVFESGGFVMWPLLLCSLISFYCAIERIIFWRNLKWHDNNIKGNIINLYLNSSSSFINLLNDDKTYPLFSILKKAIKFDNCSDESFHLALSSAMQSEMPSLRKHTNIFSTIITISPLLGLLGTVLGLINSFSFIKLGESGINAEQVTGGISEALISTATGLIIAIVTLIFSNLFNSLWKKQNSILNQYCGRFEMLYRTNKS